MLMGDPRHPHLLSPNVLHGRIVPLNAMAPNARCWFIYYADLLH